jgi:hypothetical protein
MTPGHQISHISGKTQETSVRGFVTRPINAHYPAILLTTALGELADGQRRILVEYKRFDYHSIFMA